MNNHTALYTYVWFDDIGYMIYVCLQKNDKKETGNIFT